MNSFKTFIAAAALIAAAPATFAQDAIPATWANEVIKPFTSTVTREQVRAELEAARQAGLLNSFDNDLHARVSAPVKLPTMLARTQQGAERAASLSRGADSGLSREQVRAEFLAARAAGEVNSFDNLAYLNTPVKTSRVAPAALAQASK